MLVTRDDDYMHYGRCHVWSTVKTEDPAGGGDYLSPPHTLRSEYPGLSVPLSSIFFSFTIKVIPSCCQPTCLRHSPFCSHTPSTQRNRENGLRETQGRSSAPVNRYPVQPRKSWLFQSKVYGLSFLFGFLIHALDWLNLSDN